MKQSGSRADRQPMLFSDSVEAEALRRIPLDQNLIAERWIQNLIREHPELVPMEADHHSFGPLIPIGFEVATPVGRLDNLFISPMGHITVIETKLWRNTEARREVVGQVLEYAAHLKGWSYGQLDRVALDFSRKFLGGERSLFQIVAAASDLVEDDEAEFTDAVATSLAKGRFLLAVVGDGIRESLEDMVDLIHGQPGIQFSLSLIELQLFETADLRRLVVPSLVARTVEVERAVVTVENVAVGTAATVAAPSVQKEPGASQYGKPRFTLGESEFFDHLERHSGSGASKLARQLIEETRELGCVVEWKQGSFGIKYPNLASDGPPFTLLIVRKEDGVLTRSLWSQLERAGLAKEIGLDYVRRSAELFPNMEAPAKAGKANHWSRTVSLDELFQHWADFKKLLVEVLDRINEAVDSSSAADG